MENQPAPQNPPSVPQTNPVTPEVHPPTNPPPPLETSAIPVQKKFNLKLLILIVLLFLTASGVAGFFAYQNLVTKQPAPEEKASPSPTVSLPSPIATPIASIEPDAGLDDSTATPAADLTADWPLFKDESIGIEFKYPPQIILSVQKDKKVILEHSVPFEHADPCDFAGIGIDLDKITDLQIILHLNNQGLKETILANSTESFVAEYLVDGQLKLEKGFIDEFTIGSLNGYQILQGAEGCGEYSYYFPLDAQKTLFVKRPLVTELQPVIIGYEENLKIPNIIPPEEEEEFFKQILTTFRLTN